MYRIYFDGNDSEIYEGEFCFSLCVLGSLESIAPIADKLSEGMRVVIYQTGELETEATLKFNREHGCWLARPIEGTHKYYPEGLGEGSDQN
jgi:antitoxin component YwqK of YwqJK toxin-antitoxin module